MKKRDFDTFRSGVAAWEPEALVERYARNFGRRCRGSALGTFRDQLFIYEARR